MTCNLSKSYFGKSSIDYLGHIVSPDGNFPQQNSIRAIEEGDEPTNMRQLQRYLSLCNRLHDFVSNIVQHMAPLHPFLEKDTRWRWGLEHRQAFNNLKASEH
ncbi:hypothetical protein PR048_009101 [Dryococelus australis]|uniref:Uncharacterized protein n=1 Tax=Dryococelus australis TaxID=614101 RepID=A0ABQ9HYY8_9NEOP|nr:hypothetical protein PR048_009101 [Dryococelus australis]